MDYTFENYLSEEEDVIPYEDRDHSWKDAYYGEMEDKPDTEQQLFKLQDQYLRTRDINVWRQMYDICFWYMRSMILQRCTGKMYLEPDEVFDKANGATVEFMSQYLNNPNFEVGASFAGMMKWKVVWVLYKDKDQEQTISLNQKIYDSQKELGDFVGTREDELENDYVNPEDEVCKVDMKNILDEMLEEFDEAIKYDPRLEVLIRLYMLLYIRDPRNANTKKAFIDRWAPDFKTAQLLEYVMLEFYKRIKAEAAS